MITKYFLIKIDGNRQQNSFLEQSDSDFSTDSKTLMVIET